MREEQLCKGLAGGPGSFSQLQISRKKNPIDPAPSPPRSPQGLEAKQGPSYRKGKPC